MANYKLNYSGEKIDELLTKIDNLGTGTDTKSGTVKLSNATDSNSGVSDGIAATPAAVSRLKEDMDTKANKSDVLTLEEIQASTDLSGKIASASAIRELNTAIANSGLKMDLLWTNASPSSEFAGQTLSLDCTKYKLLYIVMAISKNSTSEMVTQLIEFDGKSHSFVFAYDYVLFRTIAAYQDKKTIRISDGRIINSFGSNPDFDNNLAIPYKIYGVK